MYQRQSLFPRERVHLHGANDGKPDVMSCCWNKLRQPHPADVSEPASNITVTIGRKNSSSHPKNKWRETENPRVFMQ